MSNFLNSFNKIFKLCGLAGTKFNSHYETIYKVPDYFSDQERTLKFVNQFVTTEKRHTSEKLKIAFWKTDIQSLKERAKVQNITKFNLDEETRSSDEIELFLPLVLSDEYPGLVEALGPADKIYEGVLGSSGRTIWVFCDDRESFCLKIDTMQLDDRKFFLERILFESSIEHTLKVAKLLNEENNLFTEHEGLCLEFNYLYQEKEAKKYRCLIRRLDSDRCEIQMNDFLIPMIALGSVNFWKNQDLLRSVGITKPPSEFYLDDIAKPVADLIRNSLDKAFFHYEVHMQNLTLHIRNGKGIKFIYHDLQDALFDPTMYLLSRLQQPLPVNDFRNLCQSVYTTAFEMQKTVNINMQGQLVARKETWFESATVVSFYRRYLRNLGEYGKICNILSGRDYLLSADFEISVLKYLDLPEPDMSEVAGGSEKDFLKANLFWRLNHYYENQQQIFLDTFSRIFQSHYVDYCKQVSKDYVEEMLGSHVAIKSLNFPVHRSDIDYGKMGPVYELYEKRLLFFTYEQKPVLMFIVAR